MTRRVCFSDAGLGLFIGSICAAALYVLALVALQGVLGVAYIGYVLAAVAMVFYYMLLSGLCAGSGALLAGSRPGWIFAESFTKLRWRMMLLGVLSVLLLLGQRVVSAYFIVFFNAFMPTEAAILLSYLPWLLITPLFALFVPAMVVGYGKLLRPLLASWRLGIKGYFRLWPSMVFALLLYTLPSLVDALYLHLVGGRYEDLPRFHALQIVTVIALAFVIYLRSLWSMEKLYTLGESS